MIYKLHSSPRTHATQRIGRLAISRHATSLTIFVLKLVIGAGALMGGLYGSPKADAGIIQWRNRVASGAANPDNVGSYTNTIEMRDDVGATTGYDSGLDVDLDTSTMPNDDFFVSYVPHETQKVEYEFTPKTQIGDSYTSYLSFESNLESTHFLPNTIEFLSMDLSDNPNGVTDFAYDLKVDQFDDRIYTYFDSGNVSDVLAQATPELTPWEQVINPGQDHREKGWPGKPNGWFYGELTFTATGTPPPTPTADFNNDGIVDGNDLTDLQNGFGISGNAVLSDGDSDFDSDVDGKDFLNWQQQYNNLTQQSFANSYANASGVPEPSTLGLAGILAGAGAGYSLVNGGRKRKK